MLLGFMFAIGLGLSLAALLEALDSSVKTANDVENVLGIPVLANISYYESPKYQRQRRIRQVVMASTVLALILVGSLFVNRYVMPLEDLWATVEDRLIEMGVPIDKPEVKS